MSEYKTFIQRIGLVGVTNILITLSSLILLPIITKSFSITDYGLWVQLNVTIVLIPNLATLGLPYTMVRFLSAENDKEKIQEGFYSIAFIVLISSFIISSFLFIFAKNIALTLFNNNVDLAILLSIIVFITCLNALLLNYFRTFQQMKKYCLFMITQNYLSVFFVSYLALNGFGINITTLGLLIANFVTFIMIIISIILDIGFKIPKFKNLREYLSFGLPTIPSNLSYWLVDSSDRYVIGIILGTAFVGYYSPGYTLGSIILMISAPFALLLPSILPAYYDTDNIIKVEMFLKYSLKFFFLFSIPSVIGLSLLSKPILMILTTQEIALNGYLVTPFIALSYFLAGIYVIISNILVLEKKTKIIGTVWLIAAAFNLSLNIVLVPYFGILGAAAVTLIAYIIAFVITMFYSSKSFKFDFSKNFILKSFIASFLMSIIILLINPFGIVNIIVTVGFSILIYIISLIILKGVTKQEIILFKDFLT